MNVAIYFLLVIFYLSDFDYGYFISQCPKYVNLIRIALADNSYEDGNMQEGLKLFRQSAMNAIDKFRSGDLAGY